MRNLELVLISLLIAAVLLRVATGGWVGGRLLGGAIAASIAAHLLLEGVRLPMVPAYAAALVSIAGLFGPARSAVTRSRWRVVLASIGGLAAAALVIVPPWLYPIFTLPAPSGPHPIGGTAFSLVDESRREPFGPDSTAPRSVVVRVWYPAAPNSTGRMVPYADPRELSSPIMPLIPPPLARQYRYVKTHTIYDAEIASGPFPVLIFSHGYTGYSAQNTPQVEDLASRGYVVFSIGHSYDATAVVHPDGRVAALDPGLIASMRGMVKNQDSVVAAMGAKMERITRAATPQDRQVAFLAFAKDNPARIVQSVPVWAADTKFLMDQFRRADGPGGMGRFVGKLDTTSIGVFGMSFGGSNAGVVCLTDRRCKAGINIDGQQFGDLINDSLTVPFMIMGSEAAFVVHRPIFDRLRGPAYLLKLAGTQHIGLTDLPYFAPVLLRRLGVTGTMPVQRSEELMTNYVGAFFDTYLKGQPSPLLLQDSTVPADLTLEAKNR